MFKEVLDLLKKNRATLRVIRHEAVGTSAEVARVRGNDPARSAKAMVIQFKEGGETKYRLAVLPGNAQLDFDALKKLFNAKASLVSDVKSLTGCEKGTVPPFSFWENIPVLLDQRIADISSQPPVLAVPIEGEAGERGKYIFFNAGALDRSIALNVDDYLCITRPQMALFSKVSSGEAIAFGPRSSASERATEAVCGAGGPIFG